jgi:hypothetical protein
MQPLFSPAGSDFLSGVCGEIKRNEEKEGK